MLLSFVLCNFLVKILGAKNRRKNLHKHPGPPFQIRGGPGSFSIANLLYIFMGKTNLSFCSLNKKVDECKSKKTSILALNNILFVVKIGIL